MRPKPSSWWSVLISGQFMTWIWSPMCNPDLRLPSCEALGDLLSHSEVPHLKSGHKNNTVVVRARGIVSFRYASSSPSSSMNTENVVHLPGVKLPGPGA